MNKQDSFNYVLAGSAANVLLTYYYKTELLQNLKAPNDGDVLLIPKEPQTTKRKITFSTIDLFNIGNYTLKDNQHEDTSGTFVNKHSSINTFDSLDINIEPKVDYIIIDGINILAPDVLLDRYQEYRRNANVIKITVLEKVVHEYNTLFEKPEIKTYKIQSIRNTSRRMFNNNNSTFRMGKLMF